VAWLDDCPDGERWLRITVRTKRGVVSQEYQLELCENGYRLTRLDPATFDLVEYRIDCRSKHWRCDCPDAANSRLDGGCKHARGLRAALAAEPF
jgi:hypothetical protein